MSLELKSYDFLMQSTFDRVKEGNVFDNKLKPYSQDFFRKNSKISRR